MENTDKGDRHEKEMFWKDDLLVCTVCGGCMSTLAPAQAVPVSKLHAGLNDEPHGDDIQGN